MKNITKKVGVVLSLLITTQIATASPSYYGVIIGCCQKFKHGELTPLHAKNDAQDFYNSLIERYYGGDEKLAKNKIYLLTEKKATREKIKTALKAVAKKAKKGDYLYFFFSGHGSSLSDKKIKIDEYNSVELMKLMHNSGLIIPYDFNRHQTTKTAIIGSRDLKKNNGYGFKELDANGVQVIMISDSCYSGNIYRTSTTSSKKFIEKDRLKGIEDEFASIGKLGSKNQKVASDEYQNLIFFGAGAMDKTVAEDKRLKRGKFSLVVQKCLQKANLNNDNKITNQEFRECLASEDSAKAFVYYPNKNQRVNHTVFKDKPKHTVSNPSEKLHVKSSLRAVAKLKGVVIDPKNYEIEIVSNGTKYNIFRYTGELYATIEAKSLKDYLKAFKIFRLKGESKLTLKATSIETDKSESSYCQNEQIAVNIVNSNAGKFIVAVTLDKEGKVIMLQPNDDDKKKNHSNIINCGVQPPYGMDKFKVFALKNEQQYEDVKTLVHKGGELNPYDVDKLYKILKRKRDYQEGEINIETIETDIRTCLRGGKR